MPMRPTHRFIASYKGRLAGVIVMATPNSFSNLLGKENRHIEKLISRGACISWSPKNLASALIMFSIRWMINNTSFRLFTAYSDVEARELGTIYQACNFIYLGQSSGAKFEYFDPKDARRGWFSDRLFRKHSQVRGYARKLGIAWKPFWSLRDKICWDQIPAEITAELKAQARLHRSQCLVRKLLPKHKYAYILGKNKLETRCLKRIFENRNPQLLNLRYPKLRGPESYAAAKNLETKEDNLTSVPLDHRPQLSEESLKYLTVKEAASVLNVSHWTIYKLIESDGTFPVHNVGLKKKFIISESDLCTWMEAKKKRQTLERLRLPSGADLLGMRGDQSA